MYEEDPTQAAKIDFQQRQQRESFNNSAMFEVVKLQQQQYLDEQKRLAATKIPEYSDPVKGVTFKNQMKNTYLNMDLTIKK